MCGPEIRQQLWGHSRKKTHVARVRLWHGLFQVWKDLSSQDYEWNSLKSSLSVLDLMYQFPFNCILSYCTLKICKICSILHSLFWRECQLPCWGYDGRWFKSVRIYIHTWHLSNLWCSYYSLPFALHWLSYFLIFSPFYYLTASIFF